MACPLCILEWAQFARMVINKESKTNAKAFKATLERMESNLGWVIVRIPFDVMKTWGKRGMLKVKGEINGFAFRTSLFPTRKGYHFLLVNKWMQAGADVRTGDVARFHLEPDTAERKVVIPVELKREMAEAPALRKWLEGLNYSTRKWITDWITQVKSAEARERRAGQVAEQLFATMEAERELPPVLKAAFAREPRALAGWLKMSPSHRRGHLIAIFYYRSPDARERRIEKMIEEALMFAERKPKKEN